MIRQRAYAQIMSKVQLLTTSGQVRTLSLVSYLFSVWISYQAATVITVDTFIWLNFHHVSSPLVAHLVPPQHAAPCNEDGSDSLPTPSHRIMMQDARCIMQ